MEFSQEVTGLTRGIIIQKCFYVINAGLLVGVAITGYMLCGHVLTAHRDPSVGDLALQGESHVRLRPVDVRGRSAYDSIAANGLFGPAGRTQTELKAQRITAPEPEAEAMGETALELKLWAVTSLSPESPFAAASIEDAAARQGRRMYRVHDTVVADVTIESIHPRWVILMNARQDPPRRERLSMDDEGVELFLASASSSGPTILPPERIDIDRQSLIRDLYREYPTLVSNIKPELHLDADGNIAGIKASGIGSLPLAGELGLREGDVLQSVNQERIDSQEKLLEMVQMYQSAGSVTIGILRGGKAKTITYDLR